MIEHSIEALQQYRRRALVALLFVIALLGTFALFTIVAPGPMAARAGMFVPVFIAVTAGALASRKGPRWDPRSPEVGAILRDEYRQASMDRASRITLIVVLIAQWPIALFAASMNALSPIRMAMAIVTASTTVGLLTFLALWLVFERD
ncbi:MAG TPA: hypothetical protein VFN10_00900 [Thermoanaerobaculia bacterium]|nr:hypothetical protein [Thermoanaerobaculia bacterium]